MIVGIDPGMSGAIAFLSVSGVLVEVIDMPVTAVMIGKTKRRQLMPAVLAKTLATRKITMAMIEEVGTRPGEGAVGAFSFGRGFGQIEGVLAGLGISYAMVRPQKWKKALDLPANKSAARMYACRVWPGAAEMFARVKDDGRAEAALIGLYAAKSMKLN